MKIVKKITNLLLVSFIGGSFFIATAPLSVANAASDDECAIWLCLPYGFGEGCGSAHKAFLKRIEKRKSPLPDWNSCAIEDGSGDDRPPYSYKEEYETWYNNGTVYSRKGKSCPKSGQVIKNQSCPNGYIGKKVILEAICTNTVKYKTTFTDGQVIISEPVEHSGSNLDSVLHGKFQRKTLSNTCTRQKK